MAVVSASTLSLASLGIVVATVTTFDRPQPSPIPVDGICARAQARVMGMQAGVQPGTQAFRLYYSAQPKPGYAVGRYRLAIEFDVETAGPDGHVATRAHRGEVLVSRFGLQSRLTEDIDLAGHQPITATVRKITCHPITT